MSRRAGRPFAPAERARPGLARPDHQLHRAERARQFAGYRRAHHRGRARQFFGTGGRRDESRGGGRTIAAAATARAAPDGYTILQANANHSFSQTLYKNLSYDIEKDFVPVGRFASAFYIFWRIPRWASKT